MQKRETVRSKSHFHANKEKHDGLQTMSEFFVKSYPEGNEEKFSFMKNNRQEFFQTNEK